MSLCDNTCASGSTPAPILYLQPMMLATNCATAPEWLAPGPLQPYSPAPANGPTFGVYLAQLQMSGTIQPQYLWFVPMSGAANRAVQYGDTVGVAYLGVPATMLLASVSNSWQWQQPTGALPSAVQQFVLSRGAAVPPTQSTVLAGDALVLRSTAAAGAYLNLTDTGTPLAWIVLRATEDNQPQSNACVTPGPAPAPAPAPPAPPAKPWYRRYGWILVVILGALLVVAVVLLLSRSRANKAEISTIPPSSVAVGLPMLPSALGAPRT